MASNPTDAIERSIPFLNTQLNTWYKHADSLRTAGNAAKAEGIEECADELHERLKQLEAYFVINNCLETPTPQSLAPEHLERLHTLFWQLYRMETFIGIALAAVDGELDRYTCPQDTIELSLADAHEIAGTMIEGFDDLAKSLGVVFTREGCKFRDETEPLAVACARHGVKPEAMLAAVVEMLDTGADRPDSWEGAMAQKLKDLVQATEGQS